MTLPFLDISLKGSIVALVTPMFPNGDIDHQSYRALIDWHINEGTDALVVVATTGESQAISIDEHAELICIAVKHAAGRIPVIAGVGANSTSEAIHLTRYAKSMGAHAGLSVVPYYNKPSQEGLYRHFCSIAEAVEFPIILYNVPNRTMVDMSNETILRLAQVPGIIGIKDATGDILRGVLLIREAPVGFHIFSGDDATAAALMLLGARGNISVTANIAPKKLHELCKAALSGNTAYTNELNSKLAPINQALFLESNPIPVKWALSEMGKISIGHRLPLVELSYKYREPVRKAMHVIGLL